MFSHVYVAYFIILVWYEHLQPIAAWRKLWWSRPWAYMMSQPLLQQPRRGALASCGALTWWNIVTMQPTWAQCHPAVTCQWEWDTMLINVLALLQVSVTVTRHAWLIIRNKSVNQSP